MSAKKAHIRQPPPPPAEMSGRSIWKDDSTELGRLQGALPAPGGSSSRAHTIAAERKGQAYRAVLEAEQQELIASAPLRTGQALHRRDWVC